MMKTRTRKKDDEVSRLEKLVRELKSENRTLVKRLRKLEKGKRDYEEYEEDSKETQFETVHAPKVSNCPGCKVGVLEIVELGVRKMDKCNECGYRKTRKS